MPKLIGRVVFSLANSAVLKDSWLRSAFIYPLI